MSFSAIVPDLKYLLARSVIVSAKVYVMIVITRFDYGISLVDDVLRVSSHLSAVWVNVMVQSPRRK